MIRLAGQAGTNGSLTRAAIMQAITDLQGAGLLLDALECRLYTEGPTPNSSMLYSDYTAATGSWYAAITALTWDTPAFQDGAAEVISVDPPCIWDYSGSSAEVSVKGFLLTKTDTGVTTVFYAEDFDTPKVMGQVGDKIVVFPTLQLSPSV